MNLSLLNYSDLKTVSLFDTVDCTLKHSDTKIVHGNYIVEKSLNDTVVAIYGMRGKMYFQIGREVWNVIEDDIKFVSCSIPWTFGFYKKFVLENTEGETLFSMTYIDKYWSNFKNLIDFTYDEFDREFDDVFLWLSNNCNDTPWRKEFLEKWDSGIKIG